MRRFEYKDSRSYKFWEIEVEGDGFTARYGRVGSDGQVQTKSFASPEKAAAAAEKKIAEKVRKGYMEVAAAAPAPAPAPSGGKGDAGAARARATTSSREDFMVRADELQAAGDPWGKRIALSIAIADSKPRSDARKKLSKELAQLEKDHGEAFFGAELVELMKHEQFKKVARLTWEYGYVVKANVGTPEYDFDGPDAGEVLAALMAAPASEFLRQLTVGLTSYEGGGLGDAHQAIRGGIVHPELETVFIGDFEADQQEISWVDHGDVSGLYAKAPALKTLRLRGAGIGLGKLEHPTLERLEIETGGLPRAAVESFAKAKLPSLRHAEIWFGRTDYGGTTDITALAKLWATKGLPKLEHLGLQNSEMQDEIAIALAKSTILAQVSSVNLSMGTMREPGAQALLDHAERFKHLKSLNLGRNYIPAALQAQLRSTFGSTINLGYQESPDTWNGEEYYYTSVGE